MTESVSIVDLLKLETENRCHRQMKYQENSIKKRIMKGEKRSMHLNQHNCKLLTHTCKCMYTGINGTKLYVSSTVEPRYKEVGYNKTLL